MDFYKVQTNFPEKQSHIQIDPNPQRTSCLALNNGCKLIIIIRNKKAAGIRRDLEDIFQQEL